MQKTCTLFLLMLVFLFTSCTKNRLRKNIESYQKEDNQYKIALSIGEYFHKYPNDHEYLEKMAKLLLENGYFMECIEICNHLDNQGKNSKNIIQTRAIAHYKKLNLQKALADFNKIINDLSPWAIIKYQEAKEKQEIFNKIQEINQQLLYQPGDHSFLKKRGELYIKAKEPKAAMLDFLYFLKNEEYNDDVAYNLFRTAVAQEDFEKAREVIKIVTRYQKQSLIEVSILENILSEVLKAHELIQTNHEKKEGKMLLAKVYMQISMEYLAVDILEELKGKYPMDNVILYRLALLYSLSGQKEEGKKIITELKSKGLKIPEELSKTFE